MNSESTSPSYTLNDLISEETSRLLLRSFNHHEIRVFSGRMRQWRLRFRKNALKMFISRLAPALANTASVERALINFEHFFDRHPQPEQLLEELSKNRRLLKMLAILFAGSQFLTEILFRFPAALSVISEREKWEKPLLREQFYGKALAAASAEAKFDEQIDALRQFQQYEFLRIGASDLFGLSPLPIVVAQLTRLAIAMVRVCLRLSMESLKMAPEGFAVIALGKLGGRELNYSSDIDLVFLASSPDNIYQQLGRKLIDALSRNTSCGFLYRVDMRLRPWGGVGRLAPGLEEALNYFQKQARLWEKQALVKGRMIAGDERVGVPFLRALRPVIYALDSENVRGRIREMKQRIEKNLKKKGALEGEVKSGDGSIRDVEFVTQYLQLRYGEKYPEVRSRNTLDVLARLAGARLLSTKDFNTLSEGYTFLRTVEHHLQMMHNRQVHSLPKIRSEMAYLARRMGFSESSAGEKLEDRYHQHSRAVRGVYRRYILSRTPPAFETTVPKAPPPAREAVIEHVRRMDKSYAAMFSRAEIARHVTLAERVGETVLAVIETVPQGKTNWRLTVAGYDYLGSLSLICGLLYIYGFDVLDAAIFTYEQEHETPIKPKIGVRRRRAGAMKVRSSRRKLVDVFTVKSVDGASLPPGLWDDYEADLRTLMGALRKRNHNEVYGALAKRMAQKLRGETALADTSSFLIDIGMDNTVLKNYTVLRIDAPDTAGFLYAITNALSLNGIYIARMIVNSTANRAHDTLFVTNAGGGQINDPLKRRQLQMAIALIRHFFRLLPNSSNPESAILHFRELISQLFSREGWIEKLASLERPEVMDALARLLGVSDFLWEDFLRIQHENLFPVLHNISALKRSKTKKELAFELSHKLAAAAPDEKRKILNAFKDREMFRIDMRYIQGLIQDFKGFSRELSELAEIVLRQAVQCCLETTYEKFGEPKLVDGTPCFLSVCALGKFGGGEMGFASDIELLFIYKGEGKTSGDKSVTCSEFYNSLVAELQQTIRAKKEGIFELDLRLRPYGRAGSPAVPLDLFKIYFAPEGPAWSYERQALVRLRPVWGDPKFSREIIAARDGCLYTGDAFDAESMYAMRERQLRELVEGGTLNVKFSRGGLVDLEFLVQGLQITHGAAHPDLRRNNTIDAMRALKKRGVFSGGQFETLAAAHTFLSRLIEALRVVRGNAKDLAVPPFDSEAFSFLARRLGYENHIRLQEDIQHHTAKVKMLLAVFFPENQRAKAVSHG